MSMDYIRRTYGVPAKRGAKVRYTGATRPVEGTIVGSRGQYLRVRWDGSSQVCTHHPAWLLVYLDSA